ncbi:stage IV sporulation protein A, partial [Alicyclobacillus sendaiensis]|uniref:stage IV sporulation protein A n=1 Tax=Alicyclobacillus sendaiensis TaxID=192387 RepID=UPI0026F445E1
ENYVAAEERVVAELKELGKPIVMIVNSVTPDHPRVQQMREELTEKNDVPVLALSCATLTTHEIYYVLREALYEFPVKEVNVNLPNWVMVRDPDHWLRQQFEEAVRETIRDIRRVRDIDRVVAQFAQFSFVSACGLAHMDMGHGVAVIELDAPDELYDQVLTEIVGVQITGRDQLLKMMKEFTYAKREYDKVAEALRMVKLTGYGIAPPALEEMTLDEPELIKQGSRFGVRLKATAPSIHMIRVDVESEFAPIVGTEKQSEELVRYLMQDFEKDPLKIWESDIFGKSLAAIVREGISAKLSLMPESAPFKLKETLQRIINEGSGGLIAIIL